MSMKHGDPVKVWPKPGLRVQEHPQIHGRFLPEQGKTVPFSDWVHDRISDGSMLTTDPNPAKPLVATPLAKGDK